MACMQFPEALRLVSLALHTNHVRHVHLFGGTQASKQASKHPPGNLAACHAPCAYLLSHGVNWRCPLVGGALRALARLSRTSEKMMMFVLSFCLTKLEQQVRFRRSWMPVAHYMPTDWTMAYNGLQWHHAGLTLVRANHVFLLEPALDPAIEQQAVARVHRIGQNRYHCRDRACT